MSINLIVARDIDNGIGLNNTLPWPHNKADMKWFQNNTKGDVVLMGRKTWESIGSKPLSDRFNYVITSGQYDEASGNFNSFSSAIEQLTDQYPYNDIWIIGGASVYEQSIDVADKLYITTFDSSYECDTQISQELIDAFPIIEYTNIDGELTFEIWSKQ